MEEIDDEFENFLTTIPVDHIVDQEDHIDPLFGRIRRVYLASGHVLLKAGPSWSLLGHIPERIQAVGKVYEGIKVTATELVFDDLKTLVSFVRKFLLGTISIREIE